MFADIRLEEKVQVLNVGDGIGTASISAGGLSVQSGISTDVVMVRFTASGTMDGGHVSLQLPSGWGPMQRDPAKFDYIKIDESGVILVEPTVDSLGSNRAIAQITKLAAGQSFSFVYGSGTGGTNNGITAQDNLDPAEFIIKTDGDANDTYALVTSDTEFDDVAKVDNPKRLGQIYSTYDGKLRLDVTAAAGGTGTATVDKAEVRAAVPVTLTFEYKSSQTINDGELKFTAPGGWTPPQRDDPALPGYTDVTGIGLGDAVDDDNMSVTVPITAINKGSMITITYGVGDSAMATTVGEKPFTITIRGTEDGDSQGISDQPVVLVESQASGKGTAVASVTADADGFIDLYAGEKSRKIVVVYTETGAMVAGQVKLKLPALTDGTRRTGWSAASAAHVTAVSSEGNLGTPMYGADETLPTQEVTVTGVNLPPDGTVIFTYTGSVAVRKKDNVPFTVQTQGGITGDIFTDVSGDEDGNDATVDVGYAKAGSGEAVVDQLIVAPSPAEGADTTVTLTFTYTAAGEITFPWEFRVRVPTGWSTQLAATEYTVTHRSGTPLADTGSRTIEKLGPVGRDMVARVKRNVADSHHVMAEDEVVFEYTTTAPKTDGEYPFYVLFAERGVEGNTSVRVQGTSATQLALSSTTGTVSADPGEASLPVTVSLQDDDGTERATVNPVAVRLRSSSATGAFSATADGAGTAPITVNIAVGDTSAMAYYSDSTAGTATITATSPGSGLTADTHAVTVSTGVVEIVEGSVTVSSTIAKDDDTVTVTAMATAGQAPLALIETVMAAGGLMTESLTTPGTYTRSVLVATGTPDGTYTVTVSLGGEVETAVDMLTVDNTDPVVTVTAPESAEDGETVMISAMVTDAGTVSSVTADVSALDSTQTMLTLDDGG